MIIKRCYVANYGTLNNFKYEFNQGLNVINEDNGFGKTTLASFIKSMFYGLENSSRGKLDERKKYTPWNGGKFGGSLDFEVDGKEYRVERFFGKTVKSDKCVIIDLNTNLQSKKYTENLGYELFGVDKTSFEKSTFFPQLDLKLNGINDNIYEKLSEIVESSKDSNSYSDAKEKLEKKSTELYFNKKNGKIANNDKEIINLKGKLDTLYKLDEDLNESIAYLESLKLKADNHKNVAITLKKEISDNYENINKNNIKKGFVDLSIKIDNKKKSIESIKELGLASEEEINKLEEKANYFNLEKNNIEQLSNQKKDVFEYIDHGCCKYDDNDIEKTLNNIKTVEFNNIKIKEIEESNNYGYEKIYDDITDEKFEYINSLVNKDNNSNKGILKFIFLVASIILYIVGFINLSNKLMFIIFILLAVVFTFISVVCFVLNKNKKVNNDIDNVKEFIEKYLPNPDYKRGYHILINEIYAKYKKNLDIKDKITLDENKVKALKDNNEKICNELDEFKYKYNYSNLSIDKAVDKVKMNQVLYLDIINNNEKIDSDVLVAKENYNKEFNYYIEMISKYNLKHDNFKEINVLKERVIKYQNYLKDLNDLEAEKTEYVNTTDITSEFLDNDYEYIDSDILNNRLAKLESEYDLIKEKVISEEKKIERLSEQTSEIVTLEERLDLLTEENVNLKKEKVLIDKTIELLEEAKNNLSSNYLRPMKDSFSKYVDVICSNNNKNDFDIDINLNISVKDNGESFESEYLSKGYQDLVNICVRLALTENVFKNEKPVLILDDPFVNLDEKKLECAKNLLNNISKNYQVIYLICHDSRSL